MQTPPGVTDQHPQSSVATIIGPTLVVSGLSLVSTAFGLVYQLLVARQFGAEAGMDAYLVAMAIPNLLVMVFLNSLNFTFIPVFVQHLSRGSEEEAWKIANSVVNLVFWGVTGLCAVGIVFAPSLVNMIAPGLQGERNRLAIELLRILLPSMVFSAVSGLLSSVHYSLRSFAVPSLAPLLYTAVNLGCLWLLVGSMGIRSVAIGTTLGAAIQVVLLAPLLRRRTTYRPIYFGLGNPAVWQLLKLMLPLVAVGFVTRSTGLIERAFASQLPSGSVSYLGYAMKIASLVSGLLIGGLTTAIFPLMAEHAVDERGPSRLADTVSRGVNLMLFVTLPVAAWLAVLRVPLVSLLLERGAFDHQATLGTAGALLFYLGFLVMSAVGNVLSRAFYVLKDTSTPALVGIVGVAYYALLCSALVRSSSFAGLALSMSLYYATSSFVLLALLARKLKGFPWKRTLSSQMRIGIAAIASGFLANLAWVGLGTEANLALSVVLPGSVGVAAYLLSSWILRSEELSYLQTFVRSYSRKRSHVLLPTD